MTRSAREVPGQQPLQLWLWYLVLTAEQTRPVGAVSLHVHALDVLINKRQQGLLQNTTDVFIIIFDIII